MHFPNISLPVTDPVLIFALVMVLILVLPLAFRRLRVPGIVGLILAGVVIGPHALGVLARDQTMELLGAVGLIYIMFIAGLEVDLNEFIRHRSRSIVFGAATFAVPQGIGTLIAHFLLGFDWLSSVLLGSVFASHTLVAYPIASRLGLAKEESVTAAVGATILTDTAALLVLAVVVRAAEGALSARFWIQIVGLLALYLTAVLFLVPRLGRWFFRTVRGDGAAEFVFVLAVVYVCAYLAGVAGIEPIIGAFLAGLALNRLVPEHSTLMSRTRFVGESLFIPFFLISVGMLVDLSVLVGDTGVWLVAATMLATVTVTKWLAAQSTRLLFGYSADQAWMLFGLTVPQAAATLAAVLIGYSVGIFGDEVLNGAILMILVTCLAGPLVVERYGRRVALRVERAAFEPSRAPERILVPLANPETAPMLMDVAFMVRNPKSSQPIFPLAIVRDEPDVQAGVAAGEKLLVHAVVHAAAAAVPATPMVRVDRNVASGILRAVRERMISTIIFGWNSRVGASNHMFTGILDQVLAESRELMLVCKIEQPLGTVERVVAAVPPYSHLEPGFADGMQLVKSLARQVGAALHVAAPVEFTGAIKERMVRLKPDMPVTYRPLPDWSHLLPEIEAGRLPHDLVVLLSARQGTISWRPDLGRLPRQIALRFPDISLAVCFPPMPADEASPSFAFPSGGLDFGGLVSAERVVLDLEGPGGREVLGQLLGSAFRDQPGALDSIGPMDADSGSELMPGVVLFHAHVPVVNEPVLVVGISRPGLQMSEIGAPVHVVLVLLSPDTGSAEAHLGSLALIARLVRSSESVERLRMAVSPDEVIAFLGERLADSRID
jgi:Kef-type K+ transport system membrane component KefB